MSKTSLTAGKRVTVAPNRLSWQVSHCVLPTVMIYLFPFSETILRFCAGRLRVSGPAYQRQRLLCTKRLLERNPSSVDYALAYANALRKLGDNQQAELFCRATLKRAPLNATVLLDQAQTLMAQDKYNEAERLLTHSLVSTGPSLETAIQLSFALSAQLRMKDAITVLNPYCSDGSEHSLYAQARTATICCEFDNAIDLYLRYFKTPHFSNANHHAAWVMEACGYNQVALKFRSNLNGIYGPSFNECLAELEKSILNERNSGNCMLSKVFAVDWAFRRTYSPDKSAELANFLNYVLSRNTVPEPWYYTSKLNACNGYLDMADECHRRGVLLAPEHAGRFWAHAHIKCAKGDLSGAESSLRELLDRYPGTDAALNMLARILMDTGRKREAEAILSVEPAIGWHRILDDSILMRHN